MAIVREKTPMSRMLTQAWLVILLGVLYGGGLAAVQITLGGKISENKRNETYAVIPELVPGAALGQTEEVAYEDKTGSPRRLYKARGEAGETVGWVIPASGQGFADRIELLVAVDKLVETITGIYVLDQKETPGLGDYITGKEFRSRFAGKSTDQPLVVVKEPPKEPNQVLSLTGATISSVSVSSIVNRTIADTRPIILNFSTGEDIHGE